MNKQEQKTAAIKHLEHHQKRNPAFIDMHEFQTSDITRSSPAKDWQTSIGKKTVLFMIGSLTNYYFYNTLKGEHTSKYGRLVSALFT